MGTSSFLRGASVLSVAALGFAGSAERAAPESTGGALPREAREALAEVREAAVATLGAIGADLALWGVDPVALFDGALREMQPGLSPSLLG
ncbi:hypothetical protein [Sorangium sp. So ce1000]|uniref:hypothetical protein n=1 Tax=Sorangium sp. So ce1000 TaxID=3133325 RepID=UPI003F5FA124